MIKGSSYIPKKSNVGIERNILWCPECGKYQHFKKVYYDDGSRYYNKCFECGYQRKQ